jgi:hypothetical protein
MHYHRAQMAIKLSVQAVKVIIDYCAHIIEHHMYIIHSTEDSQHTTTPAGR